jgi:signal transduction histidine kinase
MNQDQSPEAPIAPRLPSQTLACVLNLGKIVAGMQRMLQVMITERIELALVASPDQGSIRADPGQMEQVVTNLVLNARDAMPNGGRVAIEIADAKIDRTSAGVKPSVPPGDLRGLVRHRYRHGHGR